MPTVEWFRSKIAHRKRKERYHLDAMKDAGLSPSKIKDHEEKAKWNRQSIIQLEQQQEMEHGDRFADDRAELDAIYAEIDKLIEANANDVKIPELHQKVRGIRTRMRNSFTSVVV